MLGLTERGNELPLTNFKSLSRNFLKPIFIVTSLGVFLFPFDSTFVFFALGLNLDLRSSSLRFWYSLNDTGVDRLFDTGVDEVLDVLLNVLLPLVTLTEGFSSFSIR